MGYNETQVKSMRKKRIVIKVGSSTITHASGLLNLRKLDALACVLSDLRNQGHEVLLVSSGAIAAGRGKMHRERPQTLEEKQALASAKNARYQALLEQLSPADLTLDTRQTLAALRAMGLKLAVGSSSRNARLILRRLGLENFFDAVADGTEIAHSKPDPEVFLLAARKLNLPAARCLVVEDAPAGIAAAVAGGFAAAAMGDASQDPRADFHLARLGDLVPLLTRR